MLLSDNRLNLGGPVVLVNVSMALVSGFNFLAMLGVKVGNVWTAFSLALPITRELMDNSDPLMFHADSGFNMALGVTCVMAAVYKSASTLLATSAWPLAGAACGSW